MISLEPREGANTRIHFVEYPAFDRVEPTKPQVPHCYSCHPSGLREIKPLPGEVLPSQWPAVEKLNLLIRRPPERSERLLAGARFMREKGKLGTVELAALEDHFREVAHPRNREIQQTMIDDHKAALKSWLMGNE